MIVLPEANPRRKHAWWRSRMSVPWIILLNSQIMHNFCARTHTDPETVQLSGKAEICTIRPQTVSFCGLIHNASEHHCVHDARKQLIKFVAIVTLMLFSYWQCPLIYSAMNCNPAWSAYTNTAAQAWHQGSLSSSTADHALCANNVCWAHHSHVHRMRYRRRCALTNAA